MLKKSEQQSTGQLALLFPEGGPQPALWDLWDRAGAKVGLTSVARLRWLIEFAERHDASEFPEDLALEALCFRVQQGLFIELAKASRFSGKVFWELSKAVSDGLDHLLAGTE